MQRLNELESSEKKVKNIALKISTKKNEELEDEVAESSENENVNLLVKRFGKYLKRKGTKGNPKRKKEKKPKEKHAYIAWEDNDDSTISSSS